MVPSGGTDSSACAGGASDKVSSAAAAATLEVPNLLEMVACMSVPRSSIVSIAVVVVVIAQPERFVALALAAELAVRVGIDVSGHLVGGIGIDRPIAVGP